MDRSKEEFLEQFGADYGYPAAPRGVDEMRAADFKRLEGASPLGEFQEKQLDSLLVSPVGKTILELIVIPIWQLNLSSNLLSFFPP